MRFAGNKFQHRQAVTRKSETFAHANRKQESPGTAIAAAGAPGALAKTERGGIARLYPDSVKHSLHSSAQGDAATRGGRTNLR
jgi:hypothetical protein